jgi:hypothetical protein
LSQKNPPAKAAGCGGARMALSHENRNERQQENKDSASDGNHDGYVFDDGFNWILSFV